jgi:hypothetical protein
MKKINKLVIAAVATLSVGFLIAEGAKVVLEQKETVQAPVKYLPESKELNKWFRESIESAKKDGGQVAELNWLHSMYYNCEGNRVIPVAIGLSDIDARLIFTCEELYPIKKLVVYKNSDGDFSLYTDKAFRERHETIKKLLAERIYHKFIETWALDKYRKNTSEVAANQHN